ncbi:MAG TPA: hypothetical protein VK154_11510 [Chitinophagales bacterium]|nr:hypothetical protein [Chitinophagales bacterium]
MMRVLLFILFLFHGLCSFAQSDATFSVAKKKKVFIECKYDTLAGDNYYYFKAYGISTKELIPGKFAGGQVWLNDTAVCIHTYNSTSSPKKHLLELFLRKDNSVMFSRNFTIMPKVNTEYTLGALTVFNQQPDILLESAGNTFGNKTSSKDSLLNKVNKQLALFTPRSLSNSRIISKLSIDFCRPGEIKRISTEGLKLSADMIKSLKTMDSGCYVLIYASYHSFNDPPEDRQIGPYRIDVR